MVSGVNNFREETLLKVGYKVDAQGSKLNMALGYSHPVNLDIPEGLR